MSSLIPFTQLGLDEINALLEQHQDEINLSCLSTAKLAIVTIYANSGENKPTVEVSDYLPYPKRWKIQENMELARKITPAACRDLMSIWDELNNLEKQVFVDWKEALDYRATQLS